MKKWLALTMLLLLLFCPAALALENRVFDDGNLFSSEQEAALQSQIEAIYATHAQDIVVVTTYENDASARRYADDYYENGGFGVGGDHSGALFLIDMDNRELTISTEGEMANILNDARIERLLDTMYEYASNEQYYRAVQSALTRADTYIANGPVWNQYQYNEIDPFSPRWLLISFAAGLLVAGITCGIISAKYKRNFKPVAYDDKTNTTLNLTVCNDTLVDSRVTKQYIPPASSGGGSGGGSSGRSTMHRSSSGRSHGGGSRKF
jgi:Beta-propeller domains of methanol dehydrogenase type